jgi:hypothetical protein
MKFKKNVMDNEKLQLNIPLIIREYSDKGFFIEVLVDGYMLEGMDLCWRGYVHWKQDDVWCKEDCGCLSDWKDTFNLCLEFIDDMVSKK